MPAKRVGGQIRIPRDRFEEWIGTAITVWPPVTSDTDADDVTAIAVNDTHKSCHLREAFASHEAAAVRPTLQRLTRRPVMHHPIALPHDSSNTDRCPRTGGSPHTWGGSGRVAGDDPVRGDGGDDGAVLHAVSDPG